MRERLGEEVSDRGLSVLLVFPGARQQHLERLSVVGNISGVERVSLVFFDEQTYGISSDLKDGVHRINPGANSIISFLDEFTPDIVFCAGWYDLNVLTCMRVAKTRRLPVCLMSESSILEYDKSLFKDFIKNRVLASADFFLVGGSCQARLIKAISPEISDDDIYDGYNCRDNSFFTAISKAEPKYNLCVARFVERKNVRAVIEAYRIIIRERDAEVLPLKVVGDGPQFEELSELIVSYDLEDFVELSGPVDQEGMRQLYADAGYLIVPSLFEQWGFVCNEALASGTPLIASKMLGCEELYATASSVTGVSFDPTDHVDLANKIMTAELLNYETLSRNCSYVASQFDVTAKFYRSVKNILRRVAQNHPDQFGGFPYFLWVYTYLLVAVSRVRKFSSLWFWENRKAA